MKRFKFSLQAVLTVRANEEQRAMEAFARAQAEAEKLLAQRRALESEINGVLSNRRDVFQRSTCSEELQQMQHGLRSLQLRLQQGQAALEQAQEVLRQKSNALLEARQKREVVEKVHDKQFANYQSEAARAEQKGLDDFATMRSPSAVALKWK